MKIRLEPHKVRGPQDFETVFRALAAKRPDALMTTADTLIADMVINLKTAKALGLTIPQSLLLRADEIIQ